MKQISKNWFKYGPKRKGLVRREWDKNRFWQPWDYQRSGLQAGGSWRQDNKYFIQDKSAATKKECYGKNKDYILMVLRDAATIEVPFKFAAVKYAIRRGAVEYYKGKGSRHWFNRSCFSCGSPGEHVHHIITVKNGGTDDECNLVKLCRSCHESVHGPNMGSIIGG